MQQNHWQLQEAKAKFSKLICATEDSPQFISKHGKSTAVLVSFKDYQKMTKLKHNLATFFKQSPLAELDINPRDKSKFRDIEL